MGPENVSKPFKSKTYKCPLCSKKQTKAIDQLPRNWTIEAAVQKLEALGLESAPVVPEKQFCQIHADQEISLGNNISNTCMWYITTWWRQRIGSGLKYMILGCIKCENTICFKCFYLVMSKGKDVTPCCAVSDYKPLEEFYKIKE